MGKSQGSRQNGTVYYTRAAENSDQGRQLDLKYTLEKEVSLFANR